MCWWWGIVDDDDDYYFVLFCLLVVGYILHPALFDVLKKVFLVIHTRCSWTFYKYSFTEVP